LVLEARMTGLDHAKFDELANNAKQNCPVSKLLNANIELKATLLQA
jgi:osmotically inducible protein OsmC